MAGAGNASAGSVFQKLGLRPVTKYSLVKYYMPAFGVASYTALSVNVMNPSLVIRIFPKKDITNYLLFSALAGTGSYFYTREHMEKAQISTRLLYSGTGALLLSFGSVLMWAVLRSIVPPNPTLCTLVGIGSGLLIIKVGSSYMDYIDNQIAKK
ncbi:uncharacterized protein LOC118445884 [Vespa mandarinia]|uniref:uncharacterized protein LOC118445884 n=1 Tax=Vespa mandarinia TaxID=7446 RepID=UPI00160CC622|nr:uncharacterized protein LOC118445884 [Vespa mandarinia]XP_035731824.1 uncharacterized protein LOC118445884 [Vespa mandarinia]XP_035731825.1 uncharacterized protein LOC118445884 [Vespa mandarinia]